MDRDRRQQRDRRTDQERRLDADRAAGRDRRSGADRQVALDRVRDQARVRELETKMRALENQHPEWRHTFSRHVDITKSQLDARARTGELPHGKQGPKTDNATKWQSGGAAVVVAHQLRNSDDYARARAAAEASGEPRFEVTRPLSEALGPDWRADVYGRTRPKGAATTQETSWQPDSVAIARWQRRSDGQWHMVSCYPQPHPVP